MTATSWLRANWKHIVTVALLFGMVASMVRTSRALAANAVLAAQMDTMTAEIDRKDARIRADSAALEAVYQANEGLNEQAEEAAQELQAARDAEAAARDSLDATRETLTADADSIGAEAVEVGERTGFVPYGVFVDYMNASTGALRASSAALFAQRRETARADSTATIWHGRFTDMQADYESERQGRLAALGLNRDLQARHSVALKRIDVLENAVAPSLFTRLWDSKELVAVAFVLGVATWEIAR